MTPLATFLAEIESFLVAAEMSATRFGKEALGDPSFVHDLRNNGRAPSLATVERVQKFMTEAGRAAA